jgi:hypothetical protein
MQTGMSIIVRTDEGIKSFTQSDVDKRGVKIMRSGKPAQISDFREGDKLSATIITTLPPKILTEKEVQATLATAKTAGGGAAPKSASAGNTAAKPAGSATGRPVPVAEAEEPGRCQRPPATGRWSVSEEPCR